MGDGVPNRGDSVINDEKGFLLVRLVNGCVKPLLGVVFAGLELILVNFRVVSVSNPLASTGLAVVVVVVVLVVEEVVEVLDTVELLSFNVANVDVEVEAVVGLARGRSLVEYSPGLDGLREEKEWLKIECNSLAE